MFEGNIKRFITILLFLIFSVNSSSVINAQNITHHDQVMEGRQEYIDKLRMSNDSSPFEDKSAFQSIISDSLISGINLSWLVCDSCSESPETIIDGNSINMGVSGRSESDTQSISMHGASALLPPSDTYIIDFDYDIYSWDSYNSSVYLSKKGCWDVFSVSISDVPYWQIDLYDPITAFQIPGLGFNWGGSFLGANILQHVSGSKSIEFVGNNSGANYLNVILDTETIPYSDHLYPSWGSITITNITIGGGVVAGLAAANLARSVVGGDYLWGGQGYDWIEERFVDPSDILSGYYYYLKHDPVTGKSEVIFSSGLDCSGLIIWAHNKAVGGVALDDGPIKTECANDIYYLNSIEINETQLQPGDLLFFDNQSDGRMDHVAMFVGGSNPSSDVVEAANASAGIIYSSLSVRKSAANFVGYRRVIYGYQPAMMVQSHSPVALSITDPDGNTFDVGAFIEWTMR